jgi:hypothetical protein
MTLTPEKGRNSLAIISESRAIRKLWEQEPPVRPPHVLTLQHKPLLKGRKLAVDINTITFAPDELIVPHFSGVDIAGPENLLDRLDAYSAIDSQSRYSLHQNSPR